MNLELLYVVVIIISFLIPFVVSYALLKCKKMPHSFWLSLMITLVVGSALSYVIVQIFLVRIKAY